MAILTGIDQIKRLSIIALASDDLLMENLVLKGGNAIDLLGSTGLKKLSRASYDLDFSMESDFDEELDEISARIHKVIEATFFENDLVVFDYKFMEKPKKIADDLKDFWGGYNVEFKAITKTEFERLEGNLDKIRRGAISIRPNQSSKVEIEISKYEYIGDKVEMKIDGFSIYIYSPQMMVFEKLRAICQQLPHYAEVVPSHKPRPRARDFYDIWLICEQHEIETSSAASKALLNMIFDAKKVPLSFITDIKDNVGIHRQDWQNVLDTLPAGERAEVKDFDFYLAFLLDKFKEFTSL